VKDGLKRAVPYNIRFLQDVPANPFDHGSASNEYELACKIHRSLSTQKHIIESMQENKGIPPIIKSIEDMRGIDYSGAAFHSFSLKPPLEIR